jgi:hypothetical protein
MLQWFRGHFFLKKISIIKKLISNFSSQEARRIIFKKITMLIFKKKKKGL